jgi:hypothetical protein
MITIETRFQKAKKDYVCNACEWLFESELTGFSIAEYRAMVKARRNRYMIKKGQEYLRQANVCGGDFMVFRAIPEIHDICLKYDMYQDVC